MSEVFTLIEKLAATEPTTLGSGGLGFRQRGILFPSQREDEADDSHDDQQEAARTTRWRLDGDDGLRQADPDSTDIFRQDQDIHQRNHGAIAKQYQHEERADQ